MKTILLTISYSSNNITVKGEDEDLVYYLLLTCQDDHLNYHLSNIVTVKGEKEVLQLVYSWTISYMIIISTDYEDSLA